MLLMSCVVGSAGVAAGTGLVVFWRPGLPHWVDTAQPTAELHPVPALSHGTDAGSCEFVEAAEAVFEPGHLEP